MIKLFLFTFILQSLNSQDYLYNVKNKNHSEVDNAGHVSGVYKHSCIYDTDIYHVLKDMKPVKETKNMKLIRARITPDGKEYAFKLMSDQDNYFRDLKMEIEINKRINNNTGAPTVPYYACYLAADDSICKRFMIMQFEVMYDTLDQIVSPTEQNGERYYRILKEGSYYADIEDSNVILKNFLDLFTTLMYFHHYEIVLNNVGPKNIISNLPLRTLTPDQYSNFKLYLIDYGMAAEVGEKRHLWDSLYMHPQTLTDDYCLEENDIYGLCLSYFVIMGHFNLFEVTLVNNKFFHKNIYKKERMGLEQEHGREQVQKYKELIFRKYIKIGRTQKDLDILLKKTIDKAYGRLHITGSDIFVDRQEMKRRDLGVRLGPLIANICKYDINCIMYSGIQPDYEQTPVAASIVSALTETLNKIKEDSLKKQIQQKEQNDLKI